MLRKKLVKILQDTNSAFQFSYSLFSCFCKGTSTDNINLLFIKRCLDNIAIPLLNVINTSLETTFPNDSKIATIILLPKVTNFFSTKIKSLIETLP